MQAYDLSPEANIKHNLARNFYLLDSKAKSIRIFSELHNDNRLNTTYLNTLILMQQEMGNKYFVDSLMRDLQSLDPAKYQNLLQNPGIEGTHTITWNGSRI